MEVFILALGCSADLDPNPTSPSLSPANTQLESANQGQQRVTGSIFINLADFGGAPQRMSFSAIRHRDGRVTGQFQIFSEQEPGVRVHGILTCLGIDGNLARPHRYDSHHARLRALGTAFAEVAAELRQVVAARRGNLGSGQISGQGLVSFAKTHGGADPGRPRSRFCGN